MLACLKHGLHASAAGWADPGARLLREWALRPGLGARVAIINALYTGGGPVQRMLPVLLAESLRRDRWAPSAAVPTRPVETDWDLGGTKYLVRYPLHASAYVIGVLATAQVCNAAGAAARGAVVMLPAPRAPGALCATRHQLAQFRPALHTSAYVRSGAGGAGMPWL